MPKQTAEVDVLTTLLTQNKTARLIIPKEMSLEDVRLFEQWWDLVKEATFYADTEPQAHD